MTAGWGLVACRAPLQPLLARWTTTHSRTCTSGLGSNGSCASKYSGTRSPQRGHMSCPTGGRPPPLEPQRTLAHRLPGCDGSRCDRRGPGVGDSLSACRSNAGDRPHQDTEPKPVPKPPGVVIALRDRHPRNPQTSSLSRPPFPSPTLTSCPFPPGDTSAHTFILSGIPGRPLLPRKVLRGGSPPLCNCCP